MGRGERGDALFLHQQRCKWLNCNIYNISDGSNKVLGNKPQTYQPMEVDPQSTVVEKISRLGSVLSQSCSHLIRSLRTSEASLSASSYHPRQIMAWAENVGHGENVKFHCLSQNNHSSCGNYLFIQNEYLAEPVHILWRMRFIVICFYLQTVWC